MESTNTIEKARIKTNFMYLMGDMMETALMDMDDALKDAGVEMVTEQRKKFDAAVKRIRSLRKAVTNIPKGQQIAYGNDSDMLYQFLLLLIDRCGEDDHLLLKFYEYIESFPAQLGLTLDKSVFEFLFKKDK